MSDKTPKDKETKEERIEDINAEKEQQTESVEKEDLGEKDPKEEKKEKKKKRSKKASKDDKIEELEAKVAEINDKYLRLFSEFDNFRRRTAKERLELSKSASAKLVESLLPVLDDFDRGMAAIAGDDEASKGAREGMELIYNKFMAILKREGLEEMNSKGNEFDTDFHEALTKIPAPEEDLKGKVVDVIEKGYLMNEKVIRYAKVVVGS